MEKIDFATSRLFRVGLQTLVIAAFSGASPAFAVDQDLIKRGEYLTTLGDCVGCHTTPGGKPFAGGLYMDTPVGQIASPNLTPDKETGIGNYTDEQFYRAMHEGINSQDKYLYPVFPFPWYTKVTKDDALAIKAYLFSLAPEHAPRKELKIGFPFNIREGLLTWRTLFFKEQTFEPDPKASAEVNRGAYLVEGLGHCGECHNRSNLLGASVWSGRLEGGQIEGWYAPNITSDGRDGVGNWKKEDIVKFLKTGSAPAHATIALGPMKETINDSLSHVSEEDLGAIAAYLKATAAKQSVSGSDSSKGEAKSVVAANVYLSYCSSCHQRDGKGVPGAIPQLAGNGAVTAKGPENVIRAVLGGLEADHGLGPMPALGQTMTDEQVASAVNYVRSNWGNTASADVGAGAVGALRKDALTMLAMNRPGACTPVYDAALAKVIDDGQVKDKLEKMDLANMLGTINEVLPAIKKAAPQAGPDQIANAMTSAYCPIAMAKVPENRKSIALGDFSTLVYGQARKTTASN